MNTQQTPRSGASQAIHLGSLIKLSWLAAAAQIVFAIAYIISDISANLTPPDLPAAIVALVGVLLPIFWLSLLLQALLYFGWRGCWLLVPAPFCLGLPCLVMLFGAMAGAPSS